MDDLHTAHSEDVAAKLKDKRQDLTTQRAVSAHRRDPHESHTDTRHKTVHTRRYQVTADQMRDVWPARLEWLESTVVGSEWPAGASWFQWERSMRRHAALLRELRSGNGITLCLSCCLTFLLFPILLFVPIWFLLCFVSLVSCFTCDLFHLCLLFRGSDHCCRLTTTVWLSHGVGLSRCGSL